MTLQNSIGNGVIAKAKDGFVDYRGKIPSDFKEGEKVSLIRRSDLELLLKVGIMPHAKEPLNDKDAQFPTKMVLNQHQESEQAFVFDGYLYHMMNNVWLRYRPVESLD